MGIAEFQRRELFHGGTALVMADHLDLAEQGNAVEREPAVEIF